MQKSKSCKQNFQLCEGTFLDVDLQWFLLISLKFEQASWEFPDLVVSNLVVCNCYADAISCALTFEFVCALICVHLRVSANDFV